ncbi:hypothetical protein [Streptomyces cinerochromogenes]|uniref:hypothetical protein n=1 Tax=Streptomyces cinerochromogenes TaxID=66422 RepID=UPI00167066CB|nr:hypothetical protein [Streptomyces cinerochromogenes]GGS90780.1 hypothetical protein GCM10010206_61870 [Streptomyces cinerochromogenes]
MTTDLDSDGVLDALPPGLVQDRGLVVIAPNGSVNTGTVHGGQRYTATDSPAEVPLVRQGPVRAKDLQAARGRFARPPGYTTGLDALDSSGVLFVLGAPGTGRQTLALNLLAHGHAEPVLLQVDGTVDLAHWRPRPRGVHGYLVMNLADPLSLRPWDVSRLEAETEKAGARLVVVLRETPGLARVLEDRLDVRVLRHRPPDPGEVFSLHFASLCPDSQERSRRRRRVGQETLAALLPTGLPPGRAVRVAEALARPGPEGRASGAELTAGLAAAEAARLVSAADDSPALLAHLLSVCVHQGLRRNTVLGRATELLALIRADHGPVTPPTAPPPYDGGAGRAALALPGHPDPRPAAGLPDRADPRPALALPDRADSRPALTAAAVEPPAEIAAVCAVREDGDGDPVIAFLWPAVGEAVWDEVCRARSPWLPLLHVWLGAAGDEEQAERAGRALAALAVRTAGRSLGLLADLVRTGPAAAEVAGRALAASSRLPPAAATARALLEEWSGAPEASLRATVAVACRPDADGLPAEDAMRLLRRVVDAIGDGDAAATALHVSQTLLLRFSAGTHRTRAVIVRDLAVWASVEDVAGLLAALAFPALVADDCDWFGGRLSSQEAFGETGGAGEPGKFGEEDVAGPVVALVGAALDEASAYPAMRDALLMWCAGAAGVPGRTRQLDELFARLVDSRRPGFLRLLLSIERAAETTPGKALAERSLARWRGGPAPAAADPAE